MYRAHKFNRTFILCTRISLGMSVVGRKPQNTIFKKFILLIVVKMMLNQFIGCENSQSTQLKDLLQKHTQGHTPDNGKLISMEE